MTSFSESVADAGAAQVRRGAAGDLWAIAAIYDHYVEHTSISFDLLPMPREQRSAWYEHFASRGRYQIFVAEHAGRVLGYASSHRFRDKAAYDPTVETSIYLAPDAIGQGLGRRLYGALLAALAVEDVHRAYAGIALPNPASLALHRSVGFCDVGVMTEVGRKHGRYWDVAWLEKKFDAGSA